jgi:SAM-dependent methyltransferase
MPYLLENAGEQTARRFQELQQIFDPGSMRHIAALGITAGWRCLDVGAGNGSLASWLAECVYPSGSVLATDIDTRFLDPIRVPGLEVQKHDIISDALPEASFDLIHTRLVLMHLASHDVALTRMITALKPGGWLLIEEFDCGYVPEGATFGDKSFKAFNGLMAAFASGGADVRYGRRVPGLLRERGMLDIDAEGHCFLWKGASHGARFVQTALEQLRPLILTTGCVNESEFDAHDASLNDPGVAFTSPIMWSTRARRPGGGNGAKRE